MFSEIPVIKSDLLEVYQTNGPRYTSYPTVKQFHTGFDETRYREMALETNEDLLPKPLSLYFHMPFCSTVCYYCGCNKIVTANRKHTVQYLKQLEKEIQMQSQLYDRDRRVKQLHLGGGTPTFFLPDQIHQFMQSIDQHFSLMGDDSGDYSIEIDPRQLHPDSIPKLREDGFNRISVGLQDFNPFVQMAVNRIQSYEQTEEVILQARNEGFRSINLDLIYGLPRQTIESFNETLDLVLQLNPDRLAIYHYAHLPNLFKTQKQINEADLPDSATKLALLNLAIQRLQENGYVYVGMDHFAKPEDELCRAQKNGTLQRNFQGYTTHADCDMVGMGVTSISKVGNSYSQNYSTLQEYYSSLDMDHLPIRHGYRLDMDDQLRRDVITRLICHFELNYEDIEDLYPIEFSEYFYNEIIELTHMEENGLLKVSGNQIHITPPGRLLIRNICMVFDKYTHVDVLNHYSRVV